jgi:hypothetical protein
MERVGGAEALRASYPPSSARKWLKNEHGNNTERQPEQLPKHLYAADSGNSI